MLKGYRLCLLCLVVSFILLISGLHLISDTDMDVEYIISASSVSGVSLQGTAQSLMEQLLPIRSFMQQYTVDAKKQGQNISSPYGDVIATLYAVQDDYLNLRFERLLAGRFITASDVAMERQVIVIDNQAALQLFSGQDVIGKSLRINDLAFEIIGIVQGGKKVGEADRYFAYIPFSTVDTMNLSMSTIEYLASGVEGDSSASFIQSTLSSWNPEGCFYRLAKKRLAAVMPIRVCILIIMVVLIHRLFLWLNQRSREKIHSMKMKLVNVYLQQCWPWALGNILLSLFSYACLIALVCLLVHFTITPLYTFTDWVPEKLMAFSSWVDCFWTLNINASLVQSLVSKEVLCISLSRSLILWGVVIILISLGLALFRLRSSLASNTSQPDDAD